MTEEQIVDFLIEARGLIQDADAAFLGRRFLSQDLMAEVSAKHRDAAVLLTRVLEAKGVGA